MGREGPQEREGLQEILVAGREVATDSKEKTAKAKRVSGSGWDGESGQRQRQAVGVWKSLGPGSRVTLLCVCRVGRCLGWVHFLELSNRYLLSLN